MTDPAASPRDALALRLRTIVAPYGTVREVKMFGGVAFMVDERMAVAAGRDGVCSCARILQNTTVCYCEAGCLPSWVAIGRWAGGGSPFRRR